MKPQFNPSQSMHQFFGNSQMNLFTGTIKSTRGRKRMVSDLRRQPDGVTHNVETRFAFIQLANAAKDKDELDSLIDAMGISKSTYYRWKLDIDRMNDGDLRVGTFVRRK